jgi:hypothetical protein
MNYLKTVVLAFSLILLGSNLSYASATLGTIDPTNLGSYKAQVQNTSLGSATNINFGKFTTQSAKNITVSNTELRGFAWGDGMGWIVTNCADTVGGCSAANGNFKVSNNGSGLLSGYAWGENTGWINFGPFTNTSISQVKITDGSFGGSLGAAGYAWTQNFGWMVFDCSSASSCIKTDWGVTTGGGGGGGTIPECRDGRDNDADGLIDYPADPGCSNADDNTELTPITPTLYQCNDNIDNDTDGLIDYPADSGCSSPLDNTELNTIVPTLYQCNDNIDNDGDGLIDYPVDPGCVSPLDNNEFNIVTTPVCGPLHPELCIPDPICSPQNPELCPQDQCVLNPGSCTPPPSCATDTRLCKIELTFCQKNPSACIITPPDIKTPDPIQVIKSLYINKIGNLAKILGLGSVGAASLTSFLIANPFSIVDLFLIIARLWSLTLIAFGIKKKSNPWGTVYNSVTKQPIDPAYVVLMDMQGNEIATCITDIDGRYGFAVPAGRYTIMVNKTNHEFPSKKLANKTSDELYEDLYFGGEIVVTEDGEIIDKNIPLDQIGFDWNEYAKNEQNILHSYKKKNLLASRISNSLFVIGFVITGISLFINPSNFNIIIAALYVVMGVARVIGFRVHPKGSIATSTNQPLPFSIVRVLSKVTNKEITHKVADAKGDYYALLANGDYNIVVDKKNADESYTSVPLEQSVIVKEGYLKDHFKL